MILIGEKCQYATSYFKIGVIHCRIVRDRDEHVRHSVCTSMKKENACGRWKSCIVYGDLSP